MTAVPHHVHQFEPADAERDDPRNGLLDAFEQFVDALDANDMRAQLVARLKRRFPELAAPSPVPAARQAAPTHSEALAAFVKAGPLGLDALLRELRRLEKLKMNALAHQAVQAVKHAAEAALPEALASKEKAHV